MKALRFAQFGKADVLKIEQVADPVAGVGELLIQIKAAAINPSDVAIRIGVEMPSLRWSLCDYLQHR